MNVMYLQIIIILNRLNHNYVYQIVIQIIQFQLLEDNVVIHVFII